MERGRLVQYGVELCGGDGFEMGSALAQPVTLSGTVEGKAVEVRDRGRVSHNAADHLDFAITSETEHGTLSTLATTSDTTAELVYTPDPGYAGPDSFNLPHDRQPRPRQPHRDDHARRQPPTAARRRAARRGAAATAAEEDSPAEGRGDCSGRDHQGNRARQRSSTRAPATTRSAPAAGATSSAAAGATTASSAARVETCWPTVAATTSYAHATARETRSTAIAARRIAPSSTS